MLRRLPISRAVVGVSVSRGPRRAVMRTTVRWMLPTAGAVGFVLASASGAHAGGALVHSTSPATTTVGSALTWAVDASLLDPTTTCGLQRSDGSASTETSVTSACQDAVTAGTTDVSYTPTEPGAYTLVVYPNGDATAGVSADATVSVAPVAPTLTGPTGPNASPTWTIGSLDNSETLTCTATAATLGSVPASCAAPTGADTTSDVTLDLSGATHPDTVSLTVTVTSGGQPNKTRTTYALVVAPTVTGPASGTDRTPTFAVGDIDPAATVDCTLIGPDPSAPHTCTATSAGLDLRNSPDGQYTLSVRATQNGRSASTSVDYAVDQATPVVTVPAPNTSRTVPVSIAPGPDVASLTCSVTGPTAATLSPCAPSTTLDLTSAKDGDYTVAVTVTDSLNHTATGSATYTLLQTDPVVHLPASGTSGSVPVTADLGSDVSDVSCTVAGPSAVSVTPCGASMPLDLTGAWDGTYTVTVTVTDSQGNKASGTASYTLTQVAPTVTAPAPSTSRSVTVAVDPGADVKTVDCTIAGPNGLSVAPTSCTSTGVTFTIPAGGWDGGYLVTVTITDHANNSLSDSATYTLTQVAPQVTAPAPSTTRDVTVGLDPGADVKTVACTVADPNGLAITPTDCSASGVTFTIPAGAWDGGYLVTVTVTDHANNSLSDSATYTLTQVAPKVTAPAPSTARTVTMAVAPGADVKTVDCTVVGPNLSVAPTSCNSSGVTFTIPASGYDGDYVVTVTVTDHANNSLSDSATYELTQIAPKATAPAPSTSRTVTVTVAPGADVSAVSCTIAGPNISVTPTSCTSSAVVFTIPPVGWDGGYVVTVTVTDHANHSLSDSATYTLTQVAPAITMPAPGTDRVVPLTVDPGADVKTITCSVNGPNGLAFNAATCGASMSLGIPASGLDGDYVLTVTVTDHNNSTRTATATYTLQLPPPGIAPLGAGSSRSVPVTITPGPDVSAMTCSVTGPNSLTFTPSSCTPSMTLAIPSGGWDGIYTLTVTVTDHLGDQASSSATYTLQLAPPVIGPLGSGTSRTVPVTIDPGPDVTGMTCVVSGPNVSFSPATCSTSMSFTIPANGWDGTYTVTVTVTDHLNASASSSRSYTLTLSPPVISLPAPSTDRSVPLTVDGGPDVASMVCTVAGPNGLTFTPATCGSSMQLGIPASGWDGIYTLTVTVTDHLGVSSASSANYTLLQSAPVIAMPAAGTDRIVPLTVDAGPDVSSMVCSVTDPDGIVFTPTSCATAMSIGIPAASPDGVYTLSVTATDHLGDTATTTATYFLHLSPAVVTPAGSGTARDVVVSFDAGPDVSAVGCAVTGPNNLTVPTTSCTNTSATFTIPAGGWDGNYVVTVTVTDHNGETKSSSTTYTLTQVTPTVTAPAPSTSRTVTVAGVPGADVNTITCAVAGPNGVSVPTSSCTNTSVTFTIPAAGWDGDYVVSVTVTDHNGGSLTASDVYTLTQVAPTVTAPAPSTSRTVTASVAPGADVNTITCSVAGPNGLSVPTSSCTNTSVTFTIPAVGWDGDYVVSVTITDHNGGSLTASDVYTLTQVAPTVTAPAPSTSRTVTVAVVPGADVNTVTCSVAGPNGISVTPSSCTNASVTFTIPAAGWDGDYVVSVTVT